MTRKDYILIASALRDAIYFYRSTPSHQAAIIQAAGFIGDAIKCSNRAFDEDHFLAVVRGEKELNSRP